MKPEITTNFQKHLYFENFPESKEWQLQRCIKVLEMIARLKDRISDLKLACKTMYGTDEKGSIKCSERDLNNFTTWSAMLKRLKGYYILCLSRVEKF